jgi:hypothetical protein
METILKVHLKENQNRNTVMDCINGPVAIYSREIGKKTYFMAMAFINLPMGLNIKENS